MASKSAALLLSLNLLFFTVLTSIPSSSATWPPATPAPSPPATSPTWPPASCPDYALKLAVCIPVLYAVALKLPVPQSDCCTLIGNLIQGNAGPCLCTSLKRNVLDVLIASIPYIDASLLLNYCNAANPSLCQ